jgi:hypothetical protein
MIRRDIRRRLRRTEAALASVIADKTYAPTTNQIIAAREKGEGGVREDMVGKWRM